MLVRTHPNTHGSLPPTRPWLPQFGDDVPVDDSLTYVSLQCPACARIHLAPGQLKPKCDDKYVPGSKAVAHNKMGFVRVGAQRQSLMGMFANCDRLRACG